MNRPTITPSPAASLLAQARDAIARRDPVRADAAYLEYLQSHRGDAQALAEYGDLCLRTGRNKEATYLLWKAVRLGSGGADPWAGLGHARLETADARGAREAFAKALALAPRHAIAAYGFAMCLQEERDWPGAVPAFERVLAAQPDNLPALIGLANACWHDGNPARAAEHFLRAERMAPGHPAVLLESARFYRTTGALPQAMARIEQCLRAAPNETDTLLELARCRRQMGQIDSAIAGLDALDRAHPALPDSHAERARCLATLGNADAADVEWSVALTMLKDARQYGAATALLDEWLEMAPDSALAWNSKGSLHDLQQQVEPAEAAYRRALTLDPEALAAHANLGNLCEASNRLDEALAHAQTVLSLAARQPRANAAAVATAHLLRARLARRAGQYPLALEHLDALLRSPGTPQHAQMERFERGKVLDLQGDTDGAIAAFTRGNALATLEPGVDDPHGNKFSRGLDYLLRLIDQGWLETWKLPPREAAADEPTPVFLLGFPRSGTTLLNTVLYSHSAIQVLEEEQTFAQALGMARRMPGGYPHCMPGCDALDAQLLRETYWRSVGERTSLQRGHLLIDKFPLYLTLAGLIHVAFPRAKFLFALRHPCDVVLSCFMQNFRLNEGMANFRTLADTASIYHRTMRLWQAFRDHLPLNVHTIRYEALVEDFDTHTQALCDFLGVPFEAQLRQFSRKALDRGKINTPSYEQVSQPIYAKASGRWERYRKHLQPHMHLLQPWIEHFGY